MTDKRTLHIRPKRSFEAVFVEHCAPMLAGMKPANLFRFQPSAGMAIEKAVTEWDRKLSPYGISVRIVKKCMKTGAFLIYACRREWVGKILSEQSSRDFLESLGYAADSGLDAVLRQLSDRFCLERFPHEVGLFLGYPLEDVVGFIENQGRNYTCSGYWKSYGDPAAAQKCYERYRKCTAIYAKLFENGTPIMRLIVAA